MVLTIPKTLFETLLEGRGEKVRKLARAVLPKGEIAPGRGYVLYASPWEAHKAYALAEEVENLLGRKVRVKVK